MKVRYAAHVERARLEGRPIVALETSIWCQGLPYPQNVEGARRVESALAEEGAVGALLALDAGHVRVGLEADELGAWCEARDAAKTGVRDIGWMISSARRGATTVSACVALCDFLGLSVFVTGGIGGVHRKSVGSARGAEDVSSDLWAMASHAVCVVSSGAKSILDIDATLEMLESLCVPVIGFGVEAFPEFYCHGHRWPVPRMDHPAEVAAAFQAQRGLGINASMLVTNPVPVEDALDAAQVEAWVQEAMAESSRAGVVGKALTPFLLDWLHRKSEGATLRANLSLIESNARLGARIARALLRR